LRGEKGPVANVGAKHIAEVMEKMTSINPRDILEAGKPVKNAPLLMGTTVSSFGSNMDPGGMALREWKAKSPEQRLLDSGLGFTIASSGDPTMTPEQKARAWMQDSSYWGSVARHIAAGGGKIERPDIDPAFVAGDPSIGYAETQGAPGEMGTTWTRGGMEDLIAEAQQQLGSKFPNTLRRQGNQVDILAAIMELLSTGGVR